MGKYDDVIDEPGGVAPAVQARGKYDDVIDASSSTAGIPPVTPPAPKPSAWDKITNWAARQPYMAPPAGMSDATADQTAIARKIADRLSFGVEPKLAEALGKSKWGASLGFPPPGTYARTEEERPLASGLAEIPAGAAGMAAAPARLAGEAGRGLVEATGLAASRAPQAIKTAAEAVAGGGIYSAADTALRGGTPAEIAESAAEGGVVSGGMSILPAVAQGVENFAHQRVLSSAMKPLTETAKKMQGKALTQFGHGEGKEMGQQEMRAFVDREGLQPVLRSGGAMEEEFNAKKQGVWQGEIEPIYAKAFETNPKATVPMGEIEQTVLGVIPKEMRGTAYSQKVQAVLAHLKASAEDIGKSASLNYPLKNFYENVKQIQSSGYRSVVNYDTPTQETEVRRDVGNALRGLFNDRIGRIYAANPKAAQELLGMPGGGYFRPPEAPAAQGRTTPTDIPDALLNDPDVRAVGEQLRAGNKRYSDYAKLTPVVKDAAERAAEKRKWLPALMRAGLGTGAGSVLGAAAGHALGGSAIEGAAGGMLAAEGARRAMPYAWRATEGIAGLGAGPAVNPLEPLRLDQPMTRTDYARLLGSPVGVAALRDYLKRRKDAGK